MKSVRGVFVRKGTRKGVRDWSVGGGGGEEGDDAGVDVRLGQLEQRVHYVEARLVEHNEFVRVELAHLVPAVKCSRRVYTTCAYNS